MELERALWILIYLHPITLWAIYLIFQFKVVKLDGKDGIFFIMLLS